MLGGLVAGLIALTACGRIGFDDAARRGDAPATDDAGSDDAVPLACAPLPCAGASSFMECNGTCFATCADALPRPEAAMRCAQWGGTLAVLHDAQDDACLASLVTDDMWLGFEQSATAVQVELGWSWADGVTSTYTNWRSGEPNDIDMVENGEENCAIMFVTGSWNDHQCDLVDPAVACSR